MKRDTAQLVDGAPPASCRQTGQPTHSTFLYRSYSFSLSLSLTDTRTHTYMHTYHTYICHTPDTSCRTTYVPIKRLYLLFLFPTHSDVFSARGGTSGGWKSLAAAAEDLLPAGWGWAGPWELVMDEATTDSDGWVGIHNSSPPYTESI